MVAIMKQKLKIRLGFNRPGRKNGPVQLRL